jgi:flagellar motor component MotA
MTPQDITVLIQAINDSGIIEKLNQRPNPENILINIGYILLTLFVIKTMVINGSIRKFFDFEEKKIVILGDIKGDIKEMKNEAKVDHQKLNDVLKLFDGRRRSDQE